MLERFSQTEVQRTHIGLEVAAAEVLQAATAPTPAATFTQLAAVAGKGYGALALPICTVLQHQENWQTHPQSPEILEALHAALKRDWPASPLLPQMRGLIADIFSVQPTIKSAQILCDRTTDPRPRQQAVAYLFGKAEGAVQRGDLASVLTIFPSLSLLQATSDVTRLAVLLERAVDTQGSVRPQEIVAAAKLFFEAQQELQSGFHHAELHALSPKTVLEALSRHVSLSAEDGALSPEVVTGYKLMLRHMPEEADRKRVAFSFAEGVIGFLPALDGAAVVQAVSVLADVLASAPQSNVLAGKMFDLGVSLLAVDFQAADKAAQSAAQLATEVPTRQNAGLLRRWIDNPRGPAQPAFLPAHCSLGALYNALGLNTLTETHGGAVAAPVRVLPSLKVQKP